MIAIPSQAQDWYEPFAPLFCLTPHRNADPSHWQAVRILGEVDTRLYSTKNLTTTGHTYPTRTRSPSRRHLHGRVGLSQSLRKRKPSFCSIITRPRCWCNGRPKVRLPRVFCSSHLREGAYISIRVYGQIISLRAVVTTDFMTATRAHFDIENRDFLDHVSSRITNEIEGITRVLYDGKYCS